MTIKITKKFIKMFPNWAKEGWKEGDVIDLYDVLKDMYEVVAYINYHPPKRPSGLTS